jgi:hypothetical protein
MQRPSIVTSSSSGTSSIIAPMWQWKRVTVAPDPVPISVFASPVTEDPSILNYSPDDWIAFFKNHCCLVTILSAHYQMAITGRSSCREYGEVCSHRIPTDVSVTPRGKRQLTKEDIQYMI